MRWDFQLNVDNVFDYDRPLVNGMTIFNGAMVPYAFRYAIPRAFRSDGDVRVLNRKGRGGFELKRVAPAVPGWPHAGNGRCCGGKGA
jgi:hypothetical protein